MSLLERVRNWLSPSGEKELREQLETYRLLTASLNMALADAQERYENLHAERMIQLGSVIAACGGEVKISRSVAELVYGSDDVVVNVVDEEDGVRMTLTIGGQKVEEQ